MSPTNRKPIGQILCEKGYLKQSQLEQALKEQRIGEYRPLGQILLELGYITTDELNEAIAIQAECKAKM